MLIILNKLLRTDAGNGLVDYAFENNLNYFIVDETLATKLDLATDWSTFDYRVTN